MIKFSVFLSSAMTGELDRERDGISILFRSDPTLQVFFSLYAIEGHASPQPIEKAFTEQVKTSDVLILLLDKQLREAVKQEFFAAQEQNIKIFVYIRNRTDKRDDDLTQFISKHAYKFHCGSFNGSLDLSEKINNDIISDLRRNYSQALNEPMQNTEYVAVSDFDEKPWSSSRYFDHLTISQVSESEILRDLTTDQLIILARSRQGETGNLKESLLIYEVILHRDPENWQAYNNRGLILNDMGYAEDALFSYRRALSLNSVSHATLYNIGNYYRTRCRYDEALSYYLSALKIKPDKTSALGHVVSIFLNKKDCSNSLEYAKKACSVEREETTIANLCMALTLCNEKEEALENCEELKEFKSYRKIRAYVFYFCNEYEDALFEIDTYFKEENYDYDLAIKKFNCLFNASKIEQAISWFRELENTSFVHPLDLNNVGWILSQNKISLDYSLELLYKAVDVDPSILTAWKNLQCVLGKHGKNEEGLIVSDRAVTYYPDDPGIIMNRSKFLMLNGNLRECINYMATEFGRLFGGELKQADIETMLNESVAKAGLKDIEAFERMYNLMLTSSKQSKIR